MSKLRLILFIIFFIPIIIGFSLYYWYMANIVYKDLH
jgi:hypothetical protein